MNQCNLFGVQVRPTSFHTNFVKYDMDSLRKENIFRSPLGCERQARVNWVHCRDIGEVCHQTKIYQEICQCPMMIGTKRHARWFPF